MLKDVWHDMYETVVYERCKDFMYFPFRWLTTTSVIGFCVSKDLETFKFDNASMMSSCQHFRYFSHKNNLFLKNIWKVLKIYWKGFKFYIERSSEGQHGSWYIKI